MVRGLEGACGSLEEARQQRQQVHGFRLYMEVSEQGTLMQ